VATGGATAVGGKAGAAARAGALGLNELRERYLSFFEGKGHLRMQSFPLIPQNDRSLLLINSGMAPLKPYFTGAAEPPSRRVATCQKCIRTPDIENVGKTSRHGTFFEMLGNFSFGDYFKDEAIAWAWEFMTRALGLPPEKLYASVYEDDDEAYGIWKGGVGLPESRIVRLGKADNFWEHGLGPCGPCSEIYFDRGEAYGCGSPDCAPGCDCDRFIEVWNLVFTQFDRKEDGSYERLARPNIDTGMGLERLACVVQGVGNMFEVDTIRALLDRACALAGVSYGASEASDVSIRVIADHIRSTVMMVSDGVIPSNEGRGYVLRRLLRRAARHGRLLGVEGAFLDRLSETAIELSGRAYPELSEKAAYIKKIIAIEEERFAQTLDQGLAILRDVMAGYGAAQAAGAASGESAGAGVPPIGAGDGGAGNDAGEGDSSAGDAGAGESGAGAPDGAGNDAGEGGNSEGDSGTGDAGACVPDGAPVGAAGTLDGAIVFKLHDTYGFPLDLTREIAGEAGFGIDEAGFRRNMDAQREKAKSALKSKDASAWGLSLPEALASTRPTAFAGYGAAETDSVIAGILTGGGEAAEQAGEGEMVTLILDATPFYAESGGQRADTGKITTPGGQVDVFDCKKTEGGIYLHLGEVVSGTVRAGERATAAIDAGRRAATARNHTATHLLHEALRRELGDHVRQAGSLVGPDRLRFDFSHFSQVKPDELERIEAAVNGRIFAALPVATREMDLDEAKAAGAQALFGEKYGDRVRVVSAGDFSSELCGGTHVKNTQDIGMFALLHEGGVAAGIRRIEALTGSAAHERLARAGRLLASAAALLKSEPEALPRRVEQLQAELKEKDREIEKLKAGAISGLVAEALGEATRHGPVRLIVKRLDQLDMGGLRSMADGIRGRDRGAVAVLASGLGGKASFVVAASEDAVAAGVKAGYTVKMLAQAAGGDGGGRPDMAQAGGKDASLIGKALAAAPSLIDGQLAAGK
jgi:alanyl-tRNA synthetase